MKVSRTATARFANVIEQSGKPEIVSLWTKPERDKPFMTAVRQNRVMTLKQATVGPARDFGIVGFLREKNVSYLVFPKSLQMFTDARVVGIKYDLIETPSPIGRVIKPEPHKKTQKSARIQHAESRLKSESQHQRQPTTKRSKRFTVSVRFTAIADKQEPVEAESRKKAKEIALQQVVMPDLRRATISCKVLKITET